MTEITNDDRRRVAGKIRRIDAERLDSTYGGDCLCMILTLGYIADAVGLHYAPYEFSSVELRGRLADLIDPSRDASATHTDASATVTDTSATCDRDALLALADELQGYADGAASAEGFPYVNAGDLWAYADRIREACGVTGDA